MDAHLQGIVIASEAFGLVLVSWAALDRLLFDAQDRNSALYSRMMFLLVIVSFGCFYLYVLLQFIAMILSGKGVG